jgi:glutamyl-Q tRNA(Asp) synthetase
MYARAAAPRPEPEYVAVPYRGRFAPTPSGRLHFGSIVAAVGSWLDARAHGGEWHVRIDDLDPPRVAAGAADSILVDLERLSLHWDGPVVYQSRRDQAYAEALGRIQQQAHVYACDCSRKAIAGAGAVGIEGPRYPGTCRQRVLAPRRGHALRLDVRGVTIEFVDLLQGPVRQVLETAVGDFVLRRADGVYAYHLACVVDDAAARFTHVVRGADLIDSTARQIHLQRLLGLDTPLYLHLPVALDAFGEKLSKQTKAAAIDTARPGGTLAAALAFLGHQAPLELASAPPSELLAWAKTHWDRTRLPACAALPSAVVRSVPGP